MTAGHSCHLLMDQLLPVCSGHSNVVAKAAACDMNIRNGWRSTPQRDRERESAFALSPRVSVLGRDK